MAAKGAVSKIAVHPENCANCGICQLQCSFVKTGTFNPCQARIIVDWENDEPRIAFTDDCDDCGVCARFCVYGTLEMKEER